MKKYFYIVVALAVTAGILGIGFQVHLAHNLSDVTVTESTKVGDKKYAKGITFSQMFYASNTGFHDYRWDMDIDAAKPSDSKVLFTVSGEDAEFEEFETVDTEYFDEENPLYIDSLETFCEGIEEMEELEEADLETYISSVLGESSYDEDVVYNIVKAVSDQVAKGESKTVEIVLKDYTDTMPLIVSDSCYYDIEYSEEWWPEMIQKQLPQFPLTGDEKVKVHLAKNRKGKITALSFNQGTEMDSSNACNSIMTEKGIFFTYAADSNRKTMAVYYVPMEGDYGIYYTEEDDTCKKLIVTDEGEKIDDLKWDKDSNRLILSISKDGKNTYFSCNPDEPEKLQKIQLFGKDVLGSDYDGSDDLDTVLYRGHNLMVYVNGSHGLTAWQFNRKTNKHEMVLDLDCKQAFGQGYAEYIEYDQRTKVQYKNGRLAILYPLNQDTQDSEEPAETALCVLTEDGVQYLGTYHCSLFDDAGYIIQNDAKKTYTIDMEE